MSATAQHDFRTCDSEDDGCQEHRELWQRAIENTGYRSSGSEMADTMNGRGRPYAVDAEYRRLCRKAGIAPR